MAGTWAVAALWLGLALIATMISIWLGIATALSEIVVGAIAQLLIGAVIGTSAFGADESWITFLSGTGAIVLTFLAGAELDPEVFQRKWKEAVAIGLISFAFPFLAATAGAYYVLGWASRESWLAGVALSTTSVAVVYAVMLEFGFNATMFGKVVLAACFVTDLGTVLALGLIFAPFTWKTAVFAGGGVVALTVLSSLTPRFFWRYGRRPSELETKYLLTLLFGLGALATWAGSEAVLPAYVIGMILAGTVGNDYVLIRRLRGLTFGFLTPFYFIRAGSFVSVPDLLAFPFAFLFLLLVKVAAKIAGVYPVTRLFGSLPKEGMYTTLLMSTGPYLRKDLGALRPIAQDHQPSTIFSSRGGSHRQRRDSDARGQCLLPATPLGARRQRKNAGGPGADDRLHPKILKESGLPHAKGGGHENSAERGFAPNLHRGERSLPPPPALRGDRAQSAGNAPWRRDRIARTDGLRPIEPAAHGENSAPFRRPAARH
jgi:Kef-type K+ transport system membrane component KefB